MDSLLSLNFFERCNARYYRNIIFTPRELFTYALIIKLIICLDDKSTHPSDGLNLIYLRLPLTVTCPGVTLRWGDFSTIFPDVTSMVGFCLSIF